MVVIEAPAVLAEIRERIEMLKSNGLGAEVFARVSVIFLLGKPEPSESVENVVRWSVPLDRFEEFLARVERGPF